MFPQYPRIRFRVAGVPESLGLFRLVGLSFLFLRFGFGSKVRPYGCHIQQLGSMLRHQARELHALLGIPPICFRVLHSQRKRPAWDQSSVFPTAAFVLERLGTVCVDAFKVSGVFGWRRQANDIGDTRQSVCALPRRRRIRHRNCSLSKWQKPGSAWPRRPPSEKTHDRKNETARRAASHASLNA